MRRTYLPNRKDSFFARAPGGTGALLVALVVLALRLAAPNLFWQILAPVFSAGNAVSAQSQAILDSFRNASELAKENEELARENATLLNENNILLQREADLSALIGRPLTSLKRSDGILAGVVTRPPESPYDALMVAAGTEDGVTVGQEAFAEGNVPVGVVTSALERFSRITLFSTPGLSTSGWVGPSKLAVTLYGTGGGTMRASVPRSASISPGDAIYIPGPGMLPIGTVVKVNDDSSSPAAALRIQMTANLFSTSWVLLRDMGNLRLLSASSTLP